MEIIADLHVHSRFSRATARSMDIENLHAAAQIKGIQVLGTGDFTHPGWFDEIQLKLAPAEPGLFKLKEEFARVCDLEVPPSCRGPVRFALTAEISNIYKKNDRTRKNHNLVFMPDMECAARFSARLDAIGNIRSDGRPILGLDARDLLEIVLETSDEAFLIPAHIWTPWFSMLGSKSGFDSVEECFSDLTDHIFAAETGLSSDPAMNWRVSDLDDLTLVSNSDAHSPANLGREANVFTTDLSYFAIRDALRHRRREFFAGTIEFYPDQGKYHLDGHRKCNIRFLPEQSVSHGGSCPVCGKPLTIGVLYRVQELADRGREQRPSNWFPFENLIPLADILSEVLQVGPKTKKVGRVHRFILEELGPELSVLRKVPLQDLDALAMPLLAEAVRRMRAGEVTASAGYDGEYGRITLFSETDRQRLLGQRMLFAADAVNATERSSPRAAVSPTASHPSASVKPAGAQASGQADCADESGFSLNPEQRRAVHGPDGPMLIVAGPGSGKTRTLTARIGHLIADRNVRSENILAVTFTNKAAAEMRLRLRSLLPDGRPLPVVATFHGFCHRLLREHRPDEDFTIIDDKERAFWMSEAVKRITATGQAVSAGTRQLIERIVDCKQQILGPDDIIRSDTYRDSNGIVSLVYRQYQRLLAAHRLMDYEDLIFKIVRGLESDPAFCRGSRAQFRHIFIDEYQDLNHGQYRLVRLLMPEVQQGRNLCAIGDPDQAIYGFRGSDIRYFNQFLEDYPGATVIRLERNYRSTATILKAADNVIRANKSRWKLAAARSEIEGAGPVAVLELSSDRSEADAIARTIERLIGGTGYHSIDTGIVPDANLESCRSYRDFAVLVRTHAQGRVIAGVFDDVGIPYQLANRDSILNLPEIGALLAVLRTVVGFGSLAELGRAAAALMPGISKKTVSLFRDVCLRKNLSPGDGFRLAERFPIAGLDRNQQMSVNELGREIETLRDRIQGENTFRKLLILSDRLGSAEFFSPQGKNPHARDHLSELADRFPTDTGNFLAAVALDSDADIYSARAERVPLMTIHAAKGLEFPVVFIAGCENMLLPLQRSSREPVDIEEERRLFYVAMTRAGRQLYLSWARRRRIHGRSESRERSPFLADIEDRWLTTCRPAKSPKKTKAACQRQMSLF